jgi:hypothetical protein
MKSASKLVVLGLSLSLVACAAEEGEPVEPELTVPASATSVAADVGETGKAISTLAPALIAALDIALVDDSGDTITKDPEAYDIGFDGECLTVSWDGLDGTLEFDNCTSEVTGLFLDGALTAKLDLSPLSLEAALSDFQIGEGIYNGFVDIDRNGLTSLRMSFDNLEESGTRFDDVNIDIGRGHVTISGVGIRETKDLNTTVTASSIRWQGQCWPSSGSLRYDDPENDAWDILLTFSSATPRSGTVRVEIEEGVENVELLPACAP